MRSRPRAIPSRGARGLVALDRARWTNHNATPAALGRHVVGDPDAARRPRARRPRDRARSTRPIAPRASPRPRSLPRVASPNAVPAPRRPRADSIVALFPVHPSSLLAAAAAAAATAAATNGVVPEPPPDASTAAGAVPPPPPSEACPTEACWDAVRADVGDFAAWTALIAAGEKTSSVEKIRAVYDAFLAEFPLCYGYWKKYADAETRLAGGAKTGEVYERGVAAVPYSVDLWTHYCAHAVGARADADHVRGLFERGLAYVGTDWLSHPLWDAYVDFEQNSGCGSPRHVAEVYTRVLQVPSRELDRYWTKFCEYVEGRKADALASEDELASIAAEVRASAPPAAAATGAGGGDAATGNGAEEAAAAAAEAAATADPGKDAKTIKFREARRALYETASAHRAIREPFELLIKRPYFHVKPLDDAQVANWERYLSHEESVGDAASVVRLYERCLIPCASYPALWLRYASRTERDQGVEPARAVLQRATRVFVKRELDAHLALAAFEERAGDVAAAREAHARITEEVAPGSIRAAVAHANFERRVGRAEDAKAVYERAMAVERSKEGAETPTYGCLVNQYAAFVAEALGDPAGARDVYEGAYVSASGNALVWEGGIHHERTRGDLSAKERLRRVTALVDRCCGGGGGGGGGKRDSGDEKKETTATNGDDGDDDAGGVPVDERERFSLMACEYADLVGDVDDVAAAEAKHRERFPRTVEAEAARSRKRARETQGGGGAGGKTAKVDPAAAAAAAAAQAQAAAYYGYQYPQATAAAAAGGGAAYQARSIHWSPYDPVGVVNAVP